MCHMSCITCHVSHVMCHMSCGTCHVSHVMCHMSRITCLMSHVMCPCNFFYFTYIFDSLVIFDTVGDLVGGGSVINEAYPVYFPLGYLKEREGILLCNGDSMVFAVFGIHLVFGTVLEFFP